MAKRKKHIVIDARIRQASTGRPVARLLEHLQEVDGGFKYTIILNSKDDWRQTNRNFTATRSRFGNFSFNPLNQIFYAVQLYKLKPDLVHFTLTPQQPLFYFGKQTTFTHDLTMLRFVRAGRLPDWLHAIRMRGYKLLLWSAHRKSAHILVPTQFVADDVNKYHLFTNRKTTVALESSEPPLPGRARTPENIPEEFIMYTGSAFPNKNLERLISAFCILKEHHPELKLILVGKREYHSKKLEKWARRHSHGISATPDTSSKRNSQLSSSDISTDMPKSDKSVISSSNKASREDVIPGEQRQSQSCFEDIIFTGFIPDEELKWYYQNARAYVFPSLSEGFGLPGLEAMVHGCPVVSSDATCLPEVNGDAALYFDPENIHEIAEKIDEVISNEALRKKLILKGFENSKRFSWKRFSNQHTSMFKELLEL